MVSAFAKMATPTTGLLGGDLDEDLEFAGTTPADPLGSLVAEQKAKDTRRLNVKNEGDVNIGEGETPEEFAARLGLINENVTVDTGLVGELAKQREYTAQFQAEMSNMENKSHQAFKEGIKDLFPTVPQHLIDHATYKISDLFGETIPGLKNYFPADPNFNLEDQLKEDSRENLRIFYKDVDSYEKYAQVTHHLVEEEKRKQLIREQPTDYALGGTAGIAMLPEAWIALGIRGGIRKIAKQSLKAGGFSAVRNFGKAAQEKDPEKDPYVAALKMTGLETASVFAIGGLFRGIGVGANTIKTRYGDAVGAEDAFVRHSVGEKVADDVELSAQDGVIKNMNAKEPQPQGVGADASGKFSGPQTLGEELQANSVEKTWAGLNKVTPISRILSGSDANAKQLLLEIFEVVPKLAKNTEKFAYQATETAIETLIRTKYRGDIGNLHKGVYNNYSAMLKNMGTGKVGRLAGAVGIRPNRQAPTALEFRHMVSEARRSGKQSDIPEVNASVAEVDAILTKYFDEMMELGIPWDKQMRALRAAQKKGDAKKVDELETEIENIKKGMMANKGNYLPRMWRKDKIEANFDNLVIKLKKDGGLTQAEAVATANRLKTYKPYIASDDTAKTGTASAFHARDLNFIKDEDYAEFLESDILSIITTYSRTMAPDLELYRKFGSIDLEMDNIFTGEKGPIAIVKANYEARLAEMPDASAADKIGQAQTTGLQSEMKTVLEDLYAMRDLIRGTYMMPVDPNSKISAGIRIAKNFAAMTQLTGAMAAAPDIARVVTANGLRKSMGSLFEALMNNDVWKKGLAQNREVGESFEFWLNSRAAQIADVGDTFGMHNRFESKVAGMSSLNFIINGMSLWNDFAKTATGLVTSTKILGDVEALVAGTATKAQKERLAKSGIGKEEAESIFAMKDNWQRTDANIIANSSAWDNLIAKDAFDNALSKEIGSVVVTPGLGEKPLFMSNEYVSLITQFKSFAMSSHTRVLIPALQEMDRNTLTQIALMTAIGSGVAYIRNEQLGGPEMGIDDLIFEGVGRSGWTGMFLDVDNAMHTLSGGNLSVQNLLNQGRFVTEKSALQTVVGPSGSQFMNAAELAGDILSGDVNSQDVKKLIPYNRIAHLQWLFDAPFGE